MRQILQGNVAEWSKALELGNPLGSFPSSPKGREFEPHRCHHPVRLFALCQEKIEIVFSLVSITGLYQFSDGR